MDNYIINIEKNEVKFPLSDTIFSSVLYVQCIEDVSKVVLDKAKKSELNTKSYKTTDKSGISVIINLKGHENDIEEFSKKISDIKGVISVRSVLTK